MNPWDAYVYVGIGSLLLSGAGIYAAYRGAKITSYVTLLSALLLHLGFIVYLWVVGGRPPLRTLGETRMLYSFFVLLLGGVLYYRSGYWWVLLCSSVLSGVFAVLNVLRPEIHSQELMPALQSVLFVPHVLSYMFAYGVLGVALLYGAVGAMRRGLPATHAIKTERLVRLGLGFLMVGLLLGALWAKEAWGTYWRWDPKETWAGITVLSYLLYLHHHRFHPRGERMSLVLQLVGFLCLQMCWYGVNYLPWAAESLHTYGQ